MALLLGRNLGLSHMTHAKFLDAKRLTLKGTKLKITHQIGVLQVP